MKIKAKFGYCALTADFLHIGHIRFLKRAKEYCEHLTVGVMSDICVKSYKGHFPIMKIQQRTEIIKQLRIVDDVVIQRTFNFPENLINRQDLVIIDSAEHKRHGADYIIAY